MVVYVCVCVCVCFQADKTFYGHTARILSVAWNADSSMLVSGGIDTNMVIWDAASGEKKDLIKGRFLLSCCCRFHSFSPLQDNFYHNGIKGMQTILYKLYKAKSTLLFSLQMCTILRDG